MELMQAIRARRSIRSYLDRPVEEDKLLAVPPEVRVVALLPLGYPAEMPAPRPRKSLKDIAAREHW